MTLKPSSTQSPILLLQSGGRDSAIAGARLLAAGQRVHAVTFIVDERMSSKPRERALELHRLSENYSWAAVDYRAWEEQFAEAVKRRASALLPRSCLLCAMAKLTAATTICRMFSANRIAVGYSGYQSSWAEQTPVAIRLQRAALTEQGFELLTPTLDIDSKETAIRLLQEHQLTAESLENACCVSKIGTEPVPDSLIEEVIDASFEFMAHQEPQFSVVEQLE